MPELKRVFRSWPPRVACSVLALSTVGWAQDAAACSTGPKPKPPADQTATNTPGTATVLDSPGLDGCDGAGKVGDTGNPGQTAQDGGKVTQTTKSVSGQTNERTAPVGVQSTGGKGGKGVDVFTGRIFLPKAFGGFSGNAGLGGDVALTFDGVISHQSTDASVLVVSQGGAGGQGGLGSVAQLGPATGRLGGTGGEAGTAMLAASVEIQKGAQHVDANAITVKTNGGDGGDGGRARTGGAAKASPGGGGTAGSGGDASVDLVGFSAPGTSSVVQGSVVVQAIGGDGGNAGKGNASLSATNPQRGGTGGVGGSVVMSIGPDLTIDARSSDQSKLRAAVWADTNGGSGGSGTSSDAPGGGAGSGGFGGAGGEANVTLEGKVNSKGRHLHGILAQSIAGAGGNGGSNVGLFYADGGSGGTGGDGGSAQINMATDSNVRVEGPSSIGLLAQSIGGGGGAGGDAIGINFVAGSVAIGGNGGAGGDGGGASVFLNNSTVTSIDTGNKFATIAGGGVLAQNIGGNGGSAGSAQAEGAGIGSLAIGNQGGSGGTAGPVKIVSGDSLVTTYGDHAVGLDAQSIGGGGGKGGTAITLTVGVVLATSVSVGGKGGSGGSGGQADITNSGQVLTYGPNAPGIKSASIGGGGGHGGAALATAFAFSQFPEVPALSVAVAIGGQGGQSNPGGDVTIKNSGFVGTGGHGAQALMAQSIGGGGGYGGDSSTSSFTGGGSDFKLSVNVGGGGKGGSGAVGGSVTLENSGLLATFGQDASAIHAQSIGGGGGVGGGADGNSVADDADSVSFSAEVTLGGKGGQGGTGGQVTVTNTGAIGTRGDTSHGVLAQSIGGGGGSGGSGSGSAGGGDLSLQVTVGGSGGGGHDGGKVSVTNQNTIVTSGIQSAGIKAQSIGGGGGAGGKAAATAGGSANVPPAPVLFDAVGNGLNVDEKTTSSAPGVIEVGTQQFSVDDVDPSKLLTFVTALEDEDDDDDDSTSIKVGVSVGGSGGVGGGGERAEVMNSATIQTHGSYSDGILVQSIGGGGGSGGASAGSTTTDDDGDDDATYAFSLGGRGGAGGDGGDAFVTADTGGEILTTQNYANGILAQSVGGGGGKISASKATKNASPTDVSIGGSGGSFGTGGDAFVALKGGSIETRGKHAIGIFAQSVGGGGGLSRVASTSDAVRGADIDAEDNLDFSLSFGGSGGGGGNGGLVQITVDPGSMEKPAISTTGRNSHAILAQSIGAFGGAAQGGKSTGLNFFKKGSAGRNGDADDVSVSTARDIVTSGHGAYGILAQAIGGGGGLGGDLADGGVFLHDRQPNGGSGDGATVTIKVDAGTVRATGDNAHGVFAQSIGGGGGHIATDTGVWSASAGGAGSGGIVNVSVGGPKGEVASVYAGGSDSDGISAQSDGGRGAGVVSVNVGPGSRVTGGSGDGYAIRIRGGTGLASAKNVVNNAGLLNSVTPTGRAIWADQPTEVNNTGHILGGISIPKQPTQSATASITVNNSDQGVITTGDSMDLGVGGSFANNATLEIGTGIRQVETVITGDLTQSSTGVILLDLAGSQDKVDSIQVVGDVKLDGTIAIRPSSLNRTKVLFLAATGKLEVEDGFGPRNTHLFAYDTELKNKELLIGTEADFTGAAGGDGVNSSLARHLQDIWEGDSLGFGTAFAQLSGVTGASDYAETLDVLSGRGVSAVSAARFDASLRLVDSAFSCPTFIGTSALLGERDCGWFRAEGTTFDKDGSGGGTLDYSGNSSILMFGGQREIQPGWFLGGIAGYENSRLNSDRGATDVEGDAGLALISLKRQQGPLLLAAALDIGYGQYDTTRNIDLGGSRAVARASTNSFNAGLHFRASYQFVRDHWYFQPMIDLDMTYLKLDGYQESGAGAFNLDVGKSDGMILAATPAIKVGRRIDLSGGAVLNSFASVGVSFMSGNDWETQARFATAPGGTGTFTTTLDTPDTLARITAGVEVFNEGSFNIRALYQADLATDFRSQSAEIRFSMKF